MRGSRFTDDRVVAVVRDLSSGLEVSDLCAKHGVSKRTVYAWKRLW